MFTPRAGKTEGEVALLDAGLAELELKNFPSSPLVRNGNAEWRQLKSSAKRTKENDVKK